MEAIRKRRRILQSVWVGYAAALVAVAVVSGVIGPTLAYISIPNISMLYLIAVLATAVVFGRGPALLASLAAFLTFDWFFVAPAHTFTIYDPSEWLALVLLLLTALITSQLAAGQRRRAYEAEQREREAVVLYDVVRLVGGPDLDPALNAVAERLRRELRLVGVAIDTADGVGSGVRVVAGNPAAVQIRLQGRTEMLSEGTEPSGKRRAEPGRWVRIVPPKFPWAPVVAGEHDVHQVPVKSQDRRVGVILLAHAPDAPEFDSADDRLLLAVAAQLGQALERRRLRREAAESEALRRTDELRSALLNAVSHDLRTPLASIMASAGSLLQRDVQWTDEEKDQYARAIEREAGRLNRIVGNLLDLSRIQAGSLRPELDWYDLGALVDDVLGRLRPITAPHRLVVDVEKDLPPVPLDYVEIDQVLSNLIENAAKFSPAGSEIQLCVRREAGEITVEVADRGPGIPPGSVALLFKPFNRLEGEGPRQKGTGLGLAVARGLVEAHGGKIRAENRRGGGLTVSFSLPLTPRSSIAGNDSREDSKA